MPAAAPHTGSPCLMPALLDLRAHTSSSCAAGTPGGVAGRLVTLVQRADAPSELSSLLDQLDDPLVLEHFLAGDLL